MIVSDNQRQRRRYRVLPSKRQYSEIRDISLAIGIRRSLYQTLKRIVIEKIEHILTTTGVPRSNRQIERMNRIIIPLFTKLSAPCPKNWFKYVDRIQQFVNATSFRNTGLTSFELLISKSMRLRDDVELKEIIEKNDIHMLQEKRLNLCEQAKEAIAKIQSKNKHNKKRKAVNKYRIGELVTIKRTQVSG